MAKAGVNGIEIEYDVHGADDGEALLLVTGISVQLVWWWPGFVDLLVAKGYRVIRMDNRDAGLSTHFDHIDASASMAAAFAGGPAPYTLSDIAADCVGLLDHLGIDKAHIVGQSMGGMTAQTIVLEHPERVLSLVSMSSTTGNPDVGQPDPALVSAIFAPMTAPPATREEAADAYVRVWGALAGPSYPCDEPATREVGYQSFDRDRDPVGVLRHIAAIAASGDRTARLAQIKVPALVIHGDADGLVGVSGGEATAKAIPNAELHIIEGLGHDVPAPLWKRFVELIDVNARQAVGA